MNPGLFIVFEGGVGVVKPPNYNSWPQKYIQSLTIFPDRETEKLGAESMIV